MANAQETKVDTIVKVVLVFFGCLLSFSVGTYVGKRFSDHQHQMASLSGEVGMQASNSAETMPTDSNETTASADAELSMSDEEVAQLAAEFANASGAEVVDTNEKTASEKEMPKETPTRDVASTPPTETSAEAPAAAAPEAPAATTENTASKMAEQIETSYAGKFTVQVGSFPNEKEAEKVSEDLKKKGLSAFYIAAKVADKKDESIVKTWYRVNVGLFSTSKDAELKKNDLITQKMISTGIVQKLTE